ncbi:MAG: hypothetical protein O4860_11945 [Trichodesmium sp. St2_bin2_1]|nr:hypothetical protein [Trichodesmium sp. St2_bin2_1]
MRKVILKVGANGHLPLPDWIKKSPYHLKVKAIYDAHADTSSPAIPRKTRKYRS